MSGKGYSSVNHFWVTRLPLSWRQRRGLGASPERTLHPPLAQMLAPGDSPWPPLQDKSEITCRPISYGLLTSTILFPTSSSLSEGVRFFVLLPPVLWEDFVRFHIPLVIKICRLVGPLECLPWT